MGRIFDLDSPVMRFLSRVADLIILNLLVLITIIPIITVGASFSALHYVLIKMVKNEENYIFKMYFKAFKENFKKATLLWLIMLAIILVFVFDFYIMAYSGMVFPWVFVVGVFAVAVILFMAGMYVFPLQARFENSVGRTLRNSFLIMILNLPKSVLMLLAYAVPVLLFLLSSYAVPFLIMFGISVPSLGAVYLYRKVFARFEPEAEAIKSDMDFSISTDEDAIESMGDSEEENGQTEETEETTE